MICDYCSVEFERRRKNVKDKVFCSKKCYQLSKSPGDCKICGNPIRYQRKDYCSIECRSTAYTGINNPFYGKTQTKKHKLAMVNMHTSGKIDYIAIGKKKRGKPVSPEMRNVISDSLKKYYSTHVSPNNGKTLSNAVRAKISASVRKQYIESELYRYRKNIKPAYDFYYREVWRLTEQNDLSSLKNFNKRGYKSYHLDHIVPVKKGFDLNIPADKIANIKNLNFLWWKTNIKKRTSLPSKIPKHLKKYCEKSKNS